jgi:NADH-quinone oxidoreductase subunit A
VISQFIPIAWMLLSAGILVALMMAAATWLGPKKMTVVKGEPFECGIKPNDKAHDFRFLVKYYVVAILFIIFDVEIVFLYPWAVVFRQLAGPAFLSMAIFVIVLMAGLYYAIKKGVLEWE